MHLDDILGDDRPAATAIFESVDLKRRVRTGTGVTVLTQVVGQAVQIGVLATLYRLLSPEEFGLFWMVVPVLLLLRIFCTLGLNVGTVQQTNISEETKNAVFWMTLLSGTLTSLVTAALAAPLARFYGQPRLAGLTLVMSGTSLVIAASSQHIALLERGLRLSQVAVMRVVCQLLAGAAAIIIALAGGGIWALVAQWYVETLALVAVSWWLEPWRPTPRIQWQAARHLVRFGGFFTAAGLMFALAHNLDKILVGWALGPVAEGYYSQAFAWMMKPVSLVTTPVVSLLFPALARSVHDRELYQNVLFSFTRLVGMALIPAGLGLAIVAPEAMLVLAGGAWIDAGHLLRVLAIVATVHGFINLSGAVMASVGRADRVFAASVWMAIVLTTAYGVGLMLETQTRIPAMGIAVSYTIAIFLLFIPYLRFCFAVTEISLRDWLKTLLPIIRPSLAMALVVLALRATLFALATPPGLVLPVEILAGIAIFLLLARGQASWFWLQLRRALEAQ
jgi:O-antigen/teichoic acid export membrane protein